MEVELADGRRAVDPFVLGPIVGALDLGVEDEEPVTEQFAEAGDQGSREHTVMSDRIRSLDL